MLQAAKQAIRKENSNALEQSIENVCSNTPEVDLTEVVANSNETMEVRVPYLENGYYPGLKDISKRKGRRLIKTHLPQNLLPESAKQNKSKIIYIYRNPKDVIVSYYHFVRMMKYSNYKGSLDKFARSFMSNAVPYSPYFQHISGYHKLKQQTPENVLIVAYEDLKIAPQDVIRKIASFLMSSEQYNLDDEEIEAITKLTTFETMKSDPRTNYEHWDTFGLRNTNETKFMRKGEVGNFKTHMNDSIQQEIETWISQQQKINNLQISFMFDTSEAFKQ